MHFLNIEIITSEFLSLSHLKTVFPSVQSAHVNSVKMNKLPNKMLAKIISYNQKKTRYLKRKKK